MQSLFFVFSVSTIGNRSGCSPTSLKLEDFHSCRSRFLISSEYHHQIPMPRSLRIPINPKQATIITTLKTTRIDQEHYTQCCGRRVVRQRIKGFYYGTNQAVIIQLQDIHKLTGSDDGPVFAQNFPR